MWLVVVYRRLYTTTTATKTLLFLNWLLIYPSKFEMFMITLGKRNNVNAILEVATDHCGSMVN